VESASLIAADDRLFVVTLEGRIYCFGAASADAAIPHTHSLTAKVIAIDAAASERVASILKATDNVDEGYAIVFGAGKGSFVRALAHHNNLRVIVVESDAKLANSLRSELKAAGIATDRVAVIVADPMQVELPPYLASLVIVDALPEHDPAAFVTKVFSSCAIWRHGLLPEPWKR
jgi:16S rRNA A1518/A1519 N6-dimethyltransferase RsmA/KsgA/DIM1 with predicted DNA glycosylase/AP lyase activity